MTSHVTQPRRTTSWLQSVSSTSKATTDSPTDSGRRRSLFRLLRRLGSVRSPGSNIGDGTARQGTLEMLPEDILLDILAYMNVQGVLRTAKVSESLLYPYIASNIDLLTLGLSCIAALSQHT